MFTRVTREPLSRPPRRVWRNKVCAAGTRCSPPGSVLSRAHIYGYGRSLRPPQGTSIAPRRRAVFRQTLLAGERGGPVLGEHALAFPAGADQRDLDAELSLDELDVPRGRLGKLRDLGDLVERFPPAGQRLVNRLAVVE